MRKIWGVVLVHSDASGATFVSPPASVGNFLVLMTLTNAKKDWIQHSREPELWARQIVLMWWSFREVRYKKCIFCWRDSWTRLWKLSSSLQQYKSDKSFYLFITPTAAQKNRSVWFFWQMFRRTIQWSFYRSEKKLSICLQSSCVVMQFCAYLFCCELYLANWAETFIWS